jgi:hypothetical protein
MRRVPVSCSLTVSIMQSKGLGLEKEGKARRREDLRFEV